MKEEQFVVGGLEEKHPIILFRRIFREMLFSELIILVDFPNQNPNRQITSAQKVHNRIIGALSNHPDYIFFFPELLIKKLKRSYIPTIFWEKTYLQKMLGENGFLTQDDDGNFEIEIWYHRNLIKVWEFNWHKFMMFHDSYYD